ncbi:MAG: methyltransferase domain-containing protein [Chitinophagaceae bacterium]
MPPNIPPGFIDAGEDIYYCEDFSIELPKTVLIREKEYYRFLDFIFIPAGTLNLSKEQVIIINSIRSKYLEQHPQFQKNSEVRKYFLELIKQLKPKTILEFGPDSNPLLSEPQDSIEKIFLVDFDHNSISYLKKSGIEAIHFDGSVSLKIPDNFVEFIFSIFVFHFEVSSSQIKELYRVLAEDGILIANVYKLLSEERKTVMQRMIDSGFKIKVTADNNQVCDNHEFWLLYKSIDDKKLYKAISILDQKKL